MTLKIVQITDTHISEAVPQRLQDLKNGVRAINELHEAPALIVHTGDVSHDGLSTEYHNARLVMDELKVPYVVMAGNRDNRAELLSEFSNEQYRLPNQGWVQYAIEEFAVRLIMVDTVSDNSNKGRLCEERLLHLKSMLDADTNKPAALFLHHPPFEATGIPDPYQYEDWEDVEKLSTLLAGYSKIVGMYCGHVHRFIDGNIGQLQGSAITCMAGDLRKGEVSDHQRAVPVFKEVRLA